MRTIVVTGSASGMGAATRMRRRSPAIASIGVDLRDAEVTADLGTAHVPIASPTIDAGLGEGLPASPDLAE